MKNPRFLKSDDIETAAVNAENALHSHAPSSSSAESLTRRLKQQFVSVKADLVSRSNRVDAYLRQKLDEARESIKNEKRPKSNLRIKGAVPGFRPGDARLIDRFGDMLPWDWVDKNGFFVTRGHTPSTPEGIGFTVEIAPQTGITEQMEKSLLGLTTTLPIGATLAITAYASPQVEAITEPMLAPEVGLDAFSPLDPDSRDILVRSMSARRETLNRGARHQLTPQAPVMVRHWRVWVSVVIPTAKPTDPDVLEEAATARRSIATVLDQSGLYLGVGDGQTLVTTVAELLNPAQVHARDFHTPIFNPFESPSRQVMLPDTEITVEKDRVLFTSTQAKAKDPSSVMSAVGLMVTRYPEHRWSLADATSLLGEMGRGGSQIPTPFLMTSLCRLLDPATEKVFADTHRMRALQMSQTPLSQLSPYYHEKARQWNAASKSFESEGGLALVAHQLLILAPEALEAEAVNAALTVARKSGVELRRTTCLHAQSLFSALPMAAGPILCDDLRAMGRLERRTLATALYGAPVMCEWQGSPARDDRDRKTPLLTLLGRRGQIMHVDLFANPNGNYSATIVGKPGSGKSVVMNALAVSTLAQGGLVWVIDVGRSYEKTANLLNGSFLEFDAEHVWDLNPFRTLTLLGGSAQEEAVESVVAILGELLSPFAPLPDLQRAILISLVANCARQAAKEGRAATLAELDRGLAEFAKTDRRLDDLRIQLSPYLTGPLSKWFDGSGKPLNFTSRLTVLELEGLSAHPALRQAVLMTLMLFIEKTMEKDRATVKLVLIDEAWDLMSSGHSGRFIEHGFRRARKHKGSFVVATQSIQDFFQSETAQAAWDCADTRIFLRQDAEVITALEAMGKLAPDPYFREAMASLTTMRGSWSEMLVRVGDAPPAIGRLVLDRFTQVLFSSLPAEVQAVNGWRRTGASMAEAVNLVASGYMTPSKELLAELFHKAKLGNTDGEID